ncbi:ankyrin repeat domain-containing protein [Actinomycetospora termitidis]|uniref:Ankyrin repeat domain-containing protein n=1 Tax=Actinomycetospora termitidis TaxID=3053470 RepID=A0ABT7M8V3_9PSEU|nr:ankyrin repeat domain-containing protein [Actinomycetospora sp. Odt1-22]MDL5157095.1 ankyrin repeat domain-containing protein [Actinomycetospora sp. Odt1-22]
MDEVAAAVRAVREGDLEGLRALLAEHPGLATARVEGPRTLLHVLADHPGHRPRAAGTVTLLVGAGADVDARFSGPHVETPLHWAASNDDVATIDALLDAGAWIDAPGAVLGGGSPLADACGFGQWRAAARLVERGATLTLEQAAALGRDDDVARLTGSGDLDVAFWYACHGGRLATAQGLAARGADPHARMPWEPATPLEAAEQAGADDVVGWLRGR